MEALCRDYSPLGVKFYYIYKALAHPETNGYVTPYTLEERLMHVKEAERTLGSEFTWLCDTMSNDVLHVLGRAPNSEFLIDPDGKLVRRRAWSNPEELRADLEELVGPIENPTNGSDVQLGKVEAPQVAPSGIVPRVEVDARMLPLRITPRPQEGSVNTPYYAKLRVEADERFLETGVGRMYLGFHMDSLYHVHWNNLVAPLRYELTVPDGVTLSPLSGEGPPVEEASDIDPREFLLDIEKDDTTEPLELKVTYFACNDEEGWCVPVTQHYLIHLEQDADGGWVSKRYRRPRLNEDASPSVAKAPAEAGDHGEQTDRAGDSESRD